MVFGSVHKFKFQASRLADKFKDIDSQGKLFNRMCHQTHQKLPNQDGQSSRIPDARYIPPNPELLNVDGSDVRNYDPVRDSVQTFFS